MSVSTVSSSTSMRCSDLATMGARHLAVIVLAMVASLVPDAALSQQAGMSAEQLQQALARAQGLLRQVAQQKATLEAELAKLRVDNASLERKLAGTARKLEDNEAELASVQVREQRTSASLERTRGSLETTREQLLDTVEKYKALARLQRDTEGERDALAQTLASTRRELADAQVRNRSLYAIGQELIDLYEDKSPWDGLLERESVTGLKKVEIQNRLQDIEGRLFDELTDESLESLKTGASAAGGGDATPATP